MLSELSSSNESGQRPLSPEQSQRWRRDGFLIIENALSPEEVACLTAAVDALYSEHLQNGLAKRGDLFILRNAVERHDRFLELIDHSACFGVLTDLLGPYLQLSLSRMVVRPPNPAGGEFLHTDGGQALNRILLAPESPPLQVKVQYFLTDVTERDGGNLTVVPGSQATPFPAEGVREGPRCPGAVQLVVRAGDAVIFPQSLWHGVVVNRSSRDRKSLIYGYSQQFMRQYDYEHPPVGLYEKCTQRRRRLLGDVGPWDNGSYYFATPDQLKLIKGG